MILKIILSKISDGSMKPININNQLSVLDTRAGFLKNNNVMPSQTTLVKIDYCDNNFTRYFILNNGSKGDGITSESDRVADALVVSQPNHALLLPLADCIGAVLYNKSKNILMLSHLGRHSLEQLGGNKSVKYLTDNFNIEPSDISVWISPSAGSSNYPLSKFNNRSLQAVAVEQLIDAGILICNITKSNIDTTSNDNYFSHSQYLKGERVSDGRFAIVAVIET